MFGGDLWNKASTMIAKTLEQLDAEADKLLDPSQRSDASSSGQRSPADNAAPDRFQRLQEDLEIYQKLLDDAQMQHFELSKQSRLLLAEKDAEILRLRHKYGLGPAEGETEGEGGAAQDKKTDNNNELSIDLEALDVSGEEKAILYRQLLAEKQVLESNLRELEQQLRDSVHEKSEFLLLRARYEELNTRFESLRADHVSLKSDFERREREQAQTIEQLVSEYSQLAAESELAAQSQEARLREVVRENEVLVTKMHALEHSISELADRSAAAPSPSLSASASASVSAATVTDGPSSPSPSVHTETAAVSEDKEKEKEREREREQELKELRESRAKIVNLQFDLKERGDEIDALKARLQQALSAAASNAASTAAAASSAEKEKEEQSAKESERAAASEETLRELHSLRETLTQRQREFDALCGERDEAVRSAATLTAELQQLVQQRAESERERKTERESAERELAALRAEKELVLAEKQRLQSRLEERDREREEVQRASEKESERETEKERESQREKEREWADRVRALEQRETALNAQLAALQTERERERATAQETIEQRERETASVRARLNEAERERDAERERLAENASEAEQLREKALSEARERVRVLEERVDEKEREMAALSARCEERLREQERDAQAKSEEQQRVWERSLEQHKADAETAQRELTAQFEKEREMLTKQIEQLRSDLQLAREEMEKEKQMAAEELQRSLSAQKNELETQFSSSLAAEVARTKESTTAALESEFSQREDTLRRESQNERDKLRDELLAERERESASLREILQREKENALQDARNQAHRQLESSLGDCERRKESEKSAALSELRKEADRERESSLAAAQRMKEEEISELSKQHTQTVGVLQQDLQSAKSEIAAMDAKCKAMIAEALAKLETEKNAEMEKALIAARAELQSLVEKAYAERDEHLANYTKERILRKKIHNRLLELQGNIRVICRVRPVLEVERRSGEDVDVTDIPNDEELIIQRDSQTRTKYEYDRVFGQRSTQEEVFEAVQPLCVSVLDGYNVCIFAYGQTGSGKTFTMQGYGEQHGVSPRAINELFKQVASMGSSWNYTLTLSMLEIYNETIRDLLDTSGGSKDKLEIRQAPEGNIVPGLTDVVITSPEQVRDLMKLGQTNRAVGSHDMNEHSSRSHSILTVTCRGRNALDGATTFGKLHLIDLAGSERVSKTDATGDRLKEAQSINKSLSALGDVITALGNKKATHVPFRNSKLTYLLQDSLGGNSKVLTFVNISPAVYNLGETVCSLNFAARCRSTELGTAKRQTGTVPSTPSSAVPSTPGGRDEGESVARQLLREKRLTSSSISMKR